MLGIGGKEAFGGLLLIGTPMLLGSGERIGGAVTVNLREGTS